MRYSTLGRATLAGFVVTVAVIVGCARERPAAPSVPAGRPLRIAVPRNVPPYAFRREPRLVGLEVDFARQLADALGRRLELVEGDFDELVPMLGAGRADVVMAGLSITPARAVRIAFSEPYLRSGLLALMRREDAGRYPTPASVLGSGRSIGVVTGTTGERFVREHAPLVSVTVYPDAVSAVTELKQRRVDFVVHDAPVVIWFASADEANLAPLLALLDEEELGWGLRRDDEALRAAVNGVLGRWRADGTRDRTLARWLPYWQRLEATKSAR